MKKIKGMLEDFTNNKILYLTTFSKTDEEHSRPMTNFNTDPYKMMWFPTEKNSRKVYDIQDNPRVLITFPSRKPNEFYEIEGHARLENEKVVAEKWRWWYLYWRPNQKKRFWVSSARTENRAIININPISVRVVKSD